MAQPSDYELLKRFCRGHADAFETLVERHRKLTYGFIMRMVGNRDIADDLFQEMWLKVLRAAQSYRPQAKFTTWALQIARNATLDHFKRSGLRRHASLDAKRPGEDNDTTFAETLEDSGVSHAFDGMVAGEQKAALAAAIERLPQNLREALVLRLYHELPYSEIAVMLETPEGTAKYWVHEAIKILTEHLERLGHREE